MIKLYSQFIKKYSQKILNTEYQNFTTPYSETIIWVSNL